MERDAHAELELDGLVVDNLPRFGQSGDELPVEVAFNEMVEDHLHHGLARDLVYEIGIHALGVDALVDDEFASRAGGGRRWCDAATSGEQENNDKHGKGLHGYSTNNKN